jgi:hypothetical protein
LQGSEANLLPFFSFLLPRFPLLLAPPHSAAKGMKSVRYVDFKMSYKPEIKARLATLDQLREEVLPNFISPVPGRCTLREWLDRARIPRFKQNPLAKRGGGTVFYSVSAVEKMLTDRLHFKPMAAGVAR